MPHRNFLLLLATALISYACYVRAEQNPYARYIASAYSVIDRWSLQEMSDQKLFEGAMRGMIDVLHKSGDEHSAFVNEKQRGRFREEMTQQFGGIGVRIRLLGEPALPTVVGPPLPDTPAFQADIRSGDRILAINRQSTSKMKMDEVLRLVRGLVGEPITLEVRHADEETSQDIPLMRAMITVDSIYGDLRDDKGQWNFHLTDTPRVGYIRITKFGDKTVAELTRVLADLTNPSNHSAIEALILDVRDNVGGTLDAAVGISDLFLRAGQTIITTRGRDQKTRDRFVSTGSGGYTELPLAVLINQDSASASEILAACLQDYGRAVILGQRSYGKGTVQKLFTHVESGRSLLKLTSATYWRPSEQNIHRMPGDGVQETWGVRPNQGFAISLDEQETLHWRKYRHRRDLLGDQPDGDLADQLDKADQRERAKQLPKADQSERADPVDGEHAVPEANILPKSLEDRVLQRAVEHLQRHLAEKS